MAVYYKKVDAIQFKLTDEDKERLHKKEPIFFEGCQVKHVGGNNYLAVLQQGENLYRILETQWLVRHPEGTWQIFWPDRFDKLFIEGSKQDVVNIPQQSFMTKPVNQPNILI